MRPDEAGRAGSSATGDRSGGFPVPPMPAGGAVRGAARPLHASRRTSDRRQPTARRRAAPGRRSDGLTRPSRRESLREQFWDPIAGFGVDLPDHVQEGGHRAVPVREEADGAALPRPAPAQPVARRAGEVHRLRAVRLGLPGRRDLRRGRLEHRGRQRFSPGRALRPRLPDQLPALHPLRAVHRGLPDPRAHDDQRVRARRRQPRRPDLREVRPARAAAARHGAAAAPDAARRRRGRLLPRRRSPRQRRWRATSGGRPDQ